MKNLKFIFGYVVLFLIFFFSMKGEVHNNVVNAPVVVERKVASDEDCKSLLDNLLNKKIEVNDQTRKDAITKFWKGHGDNVQGSVYHKTIRGIFKKMKTTFMDINSNYRPIFYIENDSASYPKIFKYIELKDPQGNVEGDEADLKELEDELLTWIKSYKNYTGEMDNLISQYSVNATYITKLKELKKDPQLKFPFNIELDLYYTEGPTKYKRFISNKEEIDDLIRYIRNRQKSLKGTSIFRVGKIDQRDLDQALLAQRLKALETELYAHIATNPASEEVFKDLLVDLIKLNRDSDLAPSYKFLTKLEYKEMKAEYEELFKNGQADYKKLDDFAKKIIQNLSPMYQKKLGITDTKNWVSMMKAGRTGILIAGIGTGGLGGGAIFMRLWNWYNYDKDSQFNIVNAKDEDEFRENLKKYLRGKFDMKLISRLYAKDEKEMGLKDFDPKKDDEVEILKIVNEVITLRRQFKKEEKLLEGLEEQFTKIVDGVQEKASGEVTEDHPTNNSSHSNNNDSNNNSNNDNSSDTSNDSNNDGGFTGGLTHKPNKPNCMKTPNDKRCRKPAVKPR